MGGNINGVYIFDQFYYQIVFELCVNKGYFGVFECFDICGDNSKAFVQSLIYY